jgi:hypothetical protein
MLSALAMHSDLARTRVDIIDLNGDYFLRPHSETGQQQNHGIVRLQRGPSRWMSPKESFTCSGYR